MIKKKALVKRSLEMCDKISTKRLPDEIQREIDAISKQINLVEKE
jgi:hypothetical protein